MKHLKRIKLFHNNHMKQLVKPSDEETSAESAETTERYLIVPYVHRSQYVCNPGVDDTLKERTLSFVLSDERLNIYKYRISLVFWATELDTTLSNSICQPASINKSTSGNRARYGFIEVDISTGLDELIDLGKPSSICRYRARNVEESKLSLFTLR